MSKKLTKIKSLISKLQSLNTCRIQPVEDEQRELLSSHDYIFYSKVGGVPYWPEHKPFPRIKGKYAKLMAQINFEKINHDGYLKDFPTKGILQFFYQHNHELWGLNLREDEEQPILVIYHSDISTMASYEVDYLEMCDDDQDVPYEKDFIFDVIREQELIGANDYTSEKILGIKFEDLNDDDMDYLQDNHDGSGSKIGGFAYFTQEDPGYYVDDRVVLLQLDSEFNMMWGDCGVANWFISREDLKNLDFSKVKFNWDCC